MATVTLNFPDLVKLIGRDVTLDQVRTDLFELGLETEDVQGDEVTFEVTSDRADLLCEEGIALMLRAFYGIRTGLTIPAIRKSDYRLIVNREVEQVRPYVTGAIVRNVRFTDESIKSLMHLQEKLHGTFGRKRKKGAIGVHDLSAIKGKTIHYRAVPGDSVRFVPLQSDVEMTLADVLTKHPKGVDYRYVLEDKKLMPIIVDDEAIFSFPPIINSKRTEVSIDTTDLLIELTGEDLRTIDYMLNIVLYSLDMRGAEIYGIDVVYPDRTIRRPDFGVRTLSVDVTYVNNMLGLELTAAQIKSLLERMGFGVSEATGDYVIAGIPPYRSDILHRRDVVDDVGRAYGYNNINPTYPNTPSVGALTADSRLAGAARDIMVGLGLQDTLNFVLIGRDEVSTKMNIPAVDDLVEVANPYAEQYNVVRPSILPSLLIVLSNNLHREYPQNIFEIGKTARIDPQENTGVKEEDRIACALCYAKAGYNEVKSKLQSLCLNFGKLEGLRTIAADHPSYIPGRCAEIRIGDRTVGIIGELNPVVLKRWGIEMPVAAFEMEMSALK
ncbi:MAG: Phenylalanine--tRNA ligase beta subunit [Methanocella sp. PtaU1.Bin125]|nr:MAG: Phenylalanine--tRNA ligase beta subunit [Methanocella sp. PtaU1.Bin125]